MRALKTTVYLIAFLLMAAVTYLAVVGAGSGGGEPSVTLVVEPPDLAKLQAQAAPQPVAKTQSSLTEEVASAPPVAPPPAPAAPAADAGTLAAQAPKSAEPAAVAATPNPPPAPAKPAAAPAPPADNSVEGVTIPLPE